MNAEQSGGARERQQRYLRQQKWEQVFTEGIVQALRRVPMTGALDKYREVGECQNMFIEAQKNMKLVLD